MKHFFQSTEALIPCQAFLVEKLQKENIYFANRQFLNNVNRRQHMSRIKMQYLDAILNLLLLC